MPFVLPWDNILKNLESPFVELSLQRTTLMIQEVLTKGLTDKLNLVFTHGDVLIWEYFTGLKAGDEKQFYFLN